MSTRKRRRDEAFSDEELEAQLVVEEDMNEKQKEKEQEVWDAIREAHYEAIEQLPLTLERQLSLMRKLDEQSYSLTSRLFPTLQRYIRQRQAMSEPSENGAGTSNEQDSVFVAESVECVRQTNGHPHTNGGLVAETPFRRLRNGASPTSTPGSIPPELQRGTETTREILINIGWISEELLRASQEKANLAQTNHDSVDRHIRLLDQAIEEEIASLSLGQSRLTTGIAMHLPEVVVPEWRRRKNQIRDTFASDDDLDVANQGQAPVLPEPKKSRTKAAQRNSKKKGKGRNTAGHDDQYKDSIPLTITLPATTQQDDIDVQLNEELYCYCNRESFGEMIACDNDSCEREWFHLGCVGLTEIPEGEWFCEDCRDEDA